MPEKEEDFIRRSLEQAEKSGKFYRYRLMAFRALALAGGLWFAFDNRHASTLLDVECTICIILGLIVAVCTERVRTTINTNTKRILQALEQNRPPA